MRLNRSPMMRNRQSVATPESWPYPPIDTGLPGPGETDGVSSYGLPP